MDPKVYRVLAAAYAAAIACDNLLVAVLYGDEEAPDGIREAAEASTWKVEAAKAALTRALL